MNLDAASRHKADYDLLHSCRALKVKYCPSISVVSGKSLRVVLEQTLVGRTKRQGRSRRDFLQSLTLPMDIPTETDETHVGMRDEACIRISIYLLR